MALYGAVPFMMAKRYFNYSEIYDNLLLILFFFLQTCLFLVDLGNKVLWESFGTMQLKPMST